MGGFFLKKSIALVLVISFVVPMPFVIAVRKADAQTAGSINTSGSFSANGLGGYLGSLGPVLTQLPLCQNGKLGVEIKRLFNKTIPKDGYRISKFDVDTSRTSSSSAQASSSGDNDPTLDEASFLSSFLADAVPVYDDATYQEASETKRLVKEGNKDIASLERNDTCLKSIGQAITGLMLQKITYSTVEWINTGFEGKPLFIENYETFYWDITRDEILGFNAEISDPTLYPFGKDFIRGKIYATQNGFRENARYSLNDLIRKTTPEYTAEGFNGDFTEGGWSAWLYMTQYAANNPLGFYILASEELAERVASNIEEKDFQLEQSGGFLNVPQCVSPEGITIAEHKKALNDGIKEYKTTKKLETDPQGNEYYVESKEFIGIEGTCKKWEYVTPGAYVAGKGLRAINYPEDKLLRAEDLNSAIAAVLDALLNRFTTDLFDKGLANFSTEGSDGAFVIDSNNLIIGADSQVAEDFTQYQLGSVWLQQNEDFNLRKDLTQALIDEQRTYVEKLREENTVLQDLVKTIYQLDYCIPGPNPLFETESRNVLTAVENEIVSKNLSDFTNINKEALINGIQAVGTAAGTAGGLIIGASIGSVVPGLGTAIGAVLGVVVGYVWKFVADLIFGDDEAAALEGYYAGIAKTFTGVNIDARRERGSESNSDAANVRTKHEITNAMDTMLVRYIDMIHKYYTPEFLPTVSKEASQEFKKAKSYNALTKSNAEKIIVMEGVVKRLATLKDEIDALNEDLNDGTITGEQYEEKLLPLFGEFSRLSKSMVTGDDIAVVNDLAKEGYGKIKYIYEDLLTGEFGCEKDLELNRQPVLVNNDPNVKIDPSKTSLIRGQLRPTYPFSIWYDYNEFKENAVLPSLPDEVMKKYNLKKPNNKMPSYHIGDFGPGFLSTVYFDHTDFGNSDSSPSCQPDGVVEGNFRPLWQWELDCFRTADLFPSIDAWPVTLGRNEKLNKNLPFSPKAKWEETVNNLREINASFETTIIVY